MVVSGGDPYVALPSRPVFLTVAFADTPAEPPEELAPYLVRSDVPDSALGWKLTEDAIAFGGYDLVRRVNEWHNTWLRAWPLGQRSMLRLLRDLIFADVEELSEQSRRVINALCGERVEPVESNVAVDDLAHLDAVMQRARTMIHRAERSGFGVIDTTPGAQTTGLLRAWSVALGELVLASDESSTVKLSETGLALKVRSTGRIIDQIQEVSFQADEVAVVTRTDVIDLPSVIARPLAWLVPEATSWRVRSVPETLVWADAFAGVSDALDFALEHASGVTLCREWSASTLDFVTRGRRPLSSDGT